MIDVAVAEPGELSPDVLSSAEMLVRSAFGDDFREYDWLHGVDGVHVLITEDRELLAHAAVVPRTLRHADKVFDTGYVEAVAVRGDQQGRGLGRLLMDQTESIIRTRHDLGALAAVESAAQFYAARGWQPWVGATQADTPDGVIDTYDPTDRIFLLPTDATSHDFAPSIPLICDWRAGDLW
ncbi:GNAT family N-acetyltransferase [Mycolicibacterium porcinum]|uniref:GNAT family N-acetyltransferase n=1 Tax=Mycolicibacterium porcinum TaxID=39693 RepID=UPI00119485C7|nr:GNAT family N-acetyltransferase [Mycolicibacterium porcinum]TVY05172.1 GNAT family N-acetyltransferase [Mycolicibacterium porcinum]